MEKNNYEVEPYQQSNNKLKITSNIDSQELDLSSLTETEIAEINKQYALNSLEIQKKAADLKIEISALDSTLRSFTEQTKNASESGTSATITHSQSSALGRTEVIVGNTDRAANGKISRSGRGIDDKMIIITGILAVTVIFAVLIFKFIN